MQTPSGTDKKAFDDTLVGVPTNHTEIINLLHLLTDDYTPTTSPDLADREITSSELQLSIFNHTGEEVPLALINDYMRQKGYHPRATSTLEIVWMMQYHQPNPHINPTPPQPKPRGWSPDQPPPPTS